MRENFIDALLILASAKMDLNLAQEAAEIANRIRQAKPDFTLEKFAETQPYKNPETLEQLLVTLGKAGLK